MVFAFTAIGYVVAAVLAGVIGDAVAPHAPGRIIFPVLFGSGLFGATLGYIVAKVSE